MARPTKALTATERRNFEQLVIGTAERRQGLITSSGLSADRIKECMVATMTTTPAVAQCSRDSIVSAVTKAALSGLLPDGRHAVIIPRKVNGVLTAVYQPISHGMELLARRNIKGISLNMNNVHRQKDGDDWSGDLFEDIRGASPDLVHKPDPEIDRTEETFFAAYAVAWVPGAQMPEIEIMYRNEILDHRKKWSSPDSQVWKKSFLEKTKITVLKKLLKRMPQTGDIMESIDDEEQRFDPLEVEAVEDEIEIAEEPEKLPAPRQAKKPAAKKKAAKAAPIEQQEPLPDEDEDDDPFPVEQQNEMKIEEEDVF